MLLSAENLSVHYGAQEVLRGISLSLEVGEVVALLGPNGSGKSTLMKTLIGHLPARGNIAWEDREISRWRRRDLGRRVAFLPQAPRSEAGQTARDVIRLGRSPYWGPFGLEGAGDERVVDDVADVLHLRELLDRPIDELSGGQRQRVFIGRCLAQEPVAILLDEPDTSLDIRHQLDLYTLLRELSRGRGVGVLIASHDLNLAAMHTDRLVLLDQGSIAAEGAAEKVLEISILERVYGVSMQSARGPAGELLVFPKRGAALGHA